MAIAMHVSVSGTMQCYECCEGAAVALFSRHVLKGHRNNQYTDPQQPDKTKKHTTPQPEHPTKKQQKHMFMSIYICMRDVNLCKPLQGLIWLHCHFPKLGHPNFPQHWPKLAARRLQPFGVFEV